MFSSFRTNANGRVCRRGRRISAPQVIKQACAAKRARGNARVMSDLEILQYVSTSGNSRVPWPEHKAAVASKVEQVLNEYYANRKDLNEPYDDLLQRLLTLLQDFPNPPFTVQRLCELLLDPHRIYATSTRKVASAIEKLLTVSSTVPLMQVAAPRPGSYQAASEAQLKTLVGGEASEPMDVEYK